MIAPPLALRVRGLCKSLQQRSVLSGVDLDIAPGEIVAFTGANGSGKTTLLRCIAGRLRPDSGHVGWLGVRFCKPGAARLIGMVAHEVQLYPFLTAQENLLFAARMHGLTCPAAAVRQWLHRAAIVPWGDWPAGELSRGMRQRVAIARALIHEPRVALLDEPFTGLDVAGRQWLDDLVRRWAADGGTVCFTTHEQADVCRLADRVFNVADGKICEAVGRSEARSVRAAA